MFSRLFKTPKSSLQLFRKNQAAMLPNDAESPQFPSENFSSLPIIWKVGLDQRCEADLEVRQDGRRPYHGLVEGRRDRSLQLPDALSDAQPRQGEPIARTPANRGGLRPAVRRTVV